MGASYDKLWHLLIDRHMSKTQLIKEAHISTNAMAHLGKNEDVRVEVLVKICNLFTPYELFPSHCTERTLRDIIGNGKFKSLEWGEICATDFYHAFRTYDLRMRPWIHDLKEGESAFNNKDPQKRPHRIVNGKIVENIQKNRDKYTRQRWDRFIQCVHTRNDLLAAQNTIHPNEDRVFSIRELMEMMSIPYEFRWVDYSVEKLNLLPDDQKRKIYKENEVNIRQCIGEAVPTEVMRQIAQRIKMELQTKRTTPSELAKIISDHSLSSESSVSHFIRRNPLTLSLSDLQRIAELCNAKREEISSISDFGRYGFTGLSIETICMVLQSQLKPHITNIYNMKYNLRLTQSQSYITDSQYPYFLIYRNNEFDNMSKKMAFNIFSVVRDRQITKKNTTTEKKQGYIRVIKARNIQDDGSILDIDGYDTYISPAICKSFSISSYIGNSAVYLTPNMTYKPRVIPNISYAVPDGSVAVLVPKKAIHLTQQQLNFFSSKEYRSFYLIARNYSTQSINVDSKSVFFYGVLK